MEQQKASPGHRHRQSIESSNIAEDDGERHKAMPLTRVLNRKLPMSPKTKKGLKGTDWFATSLDHRILDKAMPLRLSTEECKDSHAFVQALDILYASTASANRSPERSNKDLTSLQSARQQRYDDRAKQRQQEPGDLPTQIVSETLGV